LLGTVFLCATCLIVVGVRQALSTPADPAPYRHSQPIEYYLYAPKAYTADREWSLFVGIHGAGGTGLDCWNLWQAYADKEEFILLCPSVVNTQWGIDQTASEAVVWSAINGARALYRVQSKYFLVGHSGGAYFIQGFALHYPQSVNGLAILSSGYFIDMGEGARHIPVLLVIGSIDHPDSIRANEDYFNQLNAKGRDVQYYEIPFAGHSVTDKGKSLTIDLFRKTQGK
jgi:poly(3-hydroxybutyrate) depolymerase